MMQVDFNSRLERRLYFIALGRFCKRREGAPLAPDLAALREQWRRDRERLHRNALRH